MHRSPYTKELQKSPSNGKIKNSTEIQNITKSLQSRVKIELGV